MAIFRFPPSRKEKRNSEQAKTGSTRKKEKNILTLFYLAGKKYLKKGLWCLLGEGISSRNQKRAFERVSASKFPKKKMLTKSQLSLCTLRKYSNGRNYAERYFQNVTSEKCDLTVWFNFFPVPFPTAMKWQLNESELNIWIEMYFAWWIN